MECMPSRLCQCQKSLVASRGLGAHLSEAVGTVAVIFRHGNEVVLPGYRHGLQGKISPLRIVKRTSQGSMWEKQARCPQRVSVLRSNCACLEYLHGTRNGYVEGRSCRGLNAVVHQSKLV